MGFPKQLNKTWYVVTAHLEISEVYVVRELKKFIVLTDGSRVSKGSAWTKCFKTRTKAITYSLKKAQSDVDLTEMLLKRHKERLSALRICYKGA